MIRRLALSLLMVAYTSALLLAVFVAAFGIVWWMGALLDFLRN